MFETMAKILGASATGTFVTTVLGLHAYWRERSKSKQEATIEDYREWLRRKENSELLGGQRELLTVIEAGNDNAKIAQDYLQRLFALVERHSFDVASICDHVQRLPSMDEKLDAMIEKLEGIDSPTVPKGQVAVSARVLDLLTSAVKGSGVRVTMEHKGDMSKVGTLFFVWLLGTESPHLMLADYVGGIHDNRISLILNPDTSLTLRVYDGAGNKQELVSSPNAKAEYLIAFAVWKERSVSLWVNNKEYGPVDMDTEFAYLGPPLFFGMDIEGTLSADGVRWAPDGEQPGLNFQKDGIWHGSRYDASAIWGRVLDEKEIRQQTEDPYAMWRLSDRNFGKAIADCDAAIESKPSNAFLYVGRANILCEKGDLGGAITDYDEAIRLNPKSADAYLYRGACRALQGQYEKAIADLNEAIRLRPKSTAAHNQRAWLSATCPQKGVRDGQRALADAEKACELGCWTAATIDTLAAACAENGDYSQAIKWQMKAIDLVGEKHEAAYRSRLELYEAGKPYRENPGE